MGTTKPAWRILILVVLAVIAYLPALQLPFIADDYGQIPMARRLAAEGWAPLWHNTYLATRLTYVACVPLLYAAGIWSELNEKISFWLGGWLLCDPRRASGSDHVAARAADLLTVLFGLIAWLCWVRWLQRGGWGWYTGPLWRWSSHSPQRNPRAYFRC